MLSSCLKVRSYLRLWWSVRRIIFVSQQVMSLVLEGLNNRHGDWYSSCVGGNGIYHSGREGDWPLHPIELLAENGPTAMSEASVSRIQGSCGQGKANEVAFRKAFLRASNACWAPLVHSNRTILHKQMFRRRYRWAIDINWQKEPGASERPSGILVNWCRKRTSPRSFRAANNH